MPVNLPRTFFGFSPQADAKRPAFGLADVAIGLGVLTLLYVASRVGAQSFVRFNPPEIIPAVSLDPRNLPDYAARSTLRMFIAAPAPTLFKIKFQVAVSRRGFGNALHCLA